MGGMSRVLLIDDSPHARRMGERILNEEGFEVVTITDGIEALGRLGELDPDVVIADVFVPRKSGYELCQVLKSSDRHRHVRVVLTSGMLEAFDEAEAARVRADAVLKKPFEASVVLDLVRRLARESQEDRERASQPPPVAVATAASGPLRVDEERVRAAVVVALDAAMPVLVDEITRKVLLALGK